MNITNITMYMYGKSQCLMGNQLFLWPFSIAMLVQRVVTTAKKKSCNQQGWKGLQREANSQAVKVELKDTKLALKPCTWQRQERLKPLSCMNRRLWFGAYPVTNWMMKELQSCWTWGCSVRLRVTMVKHRPSLLTHGKVVGSCYKVMSLPHKTFALLYV